jgi:AbiV
MTRKPNPERISPSTPLPNPAQCLAGARASAAAARRLVLEAKVSERADAHGTALFLWVAALEDAVQGWALYAAWSARRGDAHDPEVEKALGELLHQHKARHAVASLVYGGPTSTTSDSDSTPSEGPGPPIILAVALGFLLLAIAYGRMSAEEREDRTRTAIAEVLAMREPTGWFAEAMGERNAGIYVDWRDGAWRSPVDVDTSRVAAARRHALPIVRSLEAAVVSDPKA